jgi:2,5-diketo-D-gluconate reductase A
VSDIPTITLNEGVEIPQLGFGVFKVPPEDTQATVELALGAGYRHIDTAAAYDNEEGVGAAIGGSGIPREEIFVTTKLPNPDHGFDSTLASFERSLSRLALEYVDLYLIHWPLPSRDLFVDTWRAFERIRDERRSRSIGVSNFRIADLERLEAETDTPPSVNQIELHPRLQQRELRTWHSDHGIATEAWSPLAKGDVLEDGAIVRIAGAHEKSPAQVVLRWHLQLGNVAIPKSVTPGRIVENRDLFDFELAEDEMAAIGGLERGERTGPDPSTFGAA